MTAVVAAAPARERMIVSGAVQGVGFRPFVYRVASGLGLDGWVRNTPAGVEIIAAGTAAALDALAQALGEQAPAAATVAAVQRAPAPGIALAPGFHLAASDTTGNFAAAIPVDVALCDACTQEIRDPGNRRYRYPFTHCTDCGPRFSVITALPYDRAATTMAAFPPCARCRAEYGDPGDRRFHAQAIACPDCGPQLVFTDRGGRALARRDDALAAAGDALRRGGIVALKGLGGYQLLVDAGNREAVARLRARKGRPRKPFAVMLPSLAAARQLCVVAAPAAAALCSAAAPIVLLPRRARAGDAALPVSDAVAPDNPCLGVMLPYTPLHRLLLDDFAAALVATSGNLSGEPLCIDDGEARDRLGGIADAFLAHDRTIARPLDDSVVQLAAGGRQLLRAARGYAPQILPLPGEVDACLLAVGGQHRNSIALARGRRAVLGPHIGDLDSVAAVDAHRHAIDDLAGLLGVTPERVAHDGHPDYAATRHARGLGLPVTAVPHHLAHAFAALAEQGLDPAEPAVAVTWDGTGLGGDGSLRGGELYRIAAGRSERIGSLRRFPLPGGEGAIRRPYRTALAVLHSLAGPPALAGDDLPPFAACTESERTLIARLLATGLRSPLTSSAGRLFDAMASLLGLCQAVTFDGEAAQQLQFAAEAAAQRGEAVPTAPVRVAPGEPACIDWGPTVSALCAAYRDGASAEACALAFHRAMAAGLAACLGTARDAGTTAVVLTGGCFQNPLLAELAMEALSARGFQPRLAREIPPNDGGIALGQLWAAVLAGAAGETAGRRPCA